MAEQRKSQNAPSTSDVMTRVGPFTDRDVWTAEGFCSIERSLDLIGTRSAMILLREVYFGGRRFDELTRRTGLSDAVAAKRLKQLVEDDVLAQQPYREPGSRTRLEYVLTERGRMLFPIVASLLQWGDAVAGGRGAVELRHAGCGAPLEVSVHCTAGHDVPLAETEVGLARRRK
jgi:DNA-binding HxlR family transcriptional regulator